jgi:hypothetical protein
LNSLCACSNLYVHAEHKGQELMRSLSVRVRNWRAPWAYASVPDAHAQHAHEFSYFSNVHFVYPQHARKELMRALSMPVRNWCIHWAYESGTGACTEHTYQVLICAQSTFPLKKCWAYTSGTDAYTLSIRVRNWCVRWAYESGTDAYPEHTHQFLTHMLSISIKIPNLKRSLQSMLCNVHACKELMRALSVCVRNWCVHWAYVSGTDAHQKLNDA